MPDNTPATITFETMDVSMSGPGDQADAPPGQ